MPSEIEGGTAVDIASYLESTIMFNKPSAVLCSIVVSNVQDWSVPLHLFVKHTSNVDLQKGKYLIEISRFCTSIETKRSI